MFTLFHSLENNYVYYFLKYKFNWNFSKETSWCTFPLFMLVERQKKKCMLKHPKIFHHPTKHYIMNNSLGNRINNDAIYFLLLYFTYIWFLDNLWGGVQHSLPDPRKISKVKHIMEFCRGREHFHLGHLPQSTCQGDQFLYWISHAIWEAPLTAIVAYPNHTWKGKSHNILSDGSSQWN